MDKTQEQSTTQLSLDLGVPPEQKSCAQITRSYASLKLVHSSSSAITEQNSDVERRSLIIEKTLSFARKLSW
jgi:hypothetical protein